VPHPARGLARPDDAFVRPPQQGHLRSDEGPSELGPSGALEDWDHSGDLKDIDVLALVIAAKHDTMDPEHLRWMADQLPRGRYLLCPEGSHLAQFDDAGHYFPGLINLLLSL